jgi:hypothetical protein
MPSHVATVVWLPPAHAAARQVVIAGYFSHAPVPRAQVPFVPHDAEP